VRSKASGQSKYGGRAFNTAVSLILAKIDIYFNFEPVDSGTNLLFIEFWNSCS
jgi:hypothetical protein